jgi:dienelactone hydrolase
MKKLAVPFVLILVLMIGPLVGGADEPAAPPDAAASVERDLEAIARDFVSLLSDREFEEAVGSFSAEMTAALTPEGLEAMWDGLTSDEEAGGFEKVVRTTPIELAGYKAIIVTCEFGNKSLGIRIVFDREASIAGIQFVPPAEGPLEYRAPAYAEPESFTQRECTVGSGEWELPATLTIPKGEGPFPAVVLVHGSGPNDRDETIGPNKPFRDLAWGLATQGVAVLRYEKRTKQHPTKIAGLMDTFTVDDEVVSDALAAVELLKKTEGIDSDRIFVIGHSLGAVMAPRIAARGEGLAGLVLLAGCPVGFYIEKAAEQAEYLISLDGEINESEAEQLEEIRTQLRTIRERDIGEGEIVLGGSMAYWADLMDYDPVRTASELTIPMLFCQGERDYQITMSDFNGWKEGLAGQEGVSFKAYPELNHLFIAGTGKSTPAEYSQPGNVAQAVIDDIAGWVDDELGR